MGEGWASFSELSLTALDTRWPWRLKRRQSNSFESEKCPTPPSTRHLNRHHAFSLFQSLWQLLPILQLQSQKVGGGRKRLEVGQSLVTDQGKKHWEKLVSQAWKIWCDMESAALDSWTNIVKPVEREGKDSISLELLTHPLFSRVKQWLSNHRVVCSELMLIDKASCVCHVQNNFTEAMLHHEATCSQFYKSKSRQHG